MKEKVKRFFASIAAVVMAVAMMGSVTAFAQTVPNTTQDTNKGSITISNAAKGETYKIYKLFDATLGSNDEVAYKGSIPTTLSTYFEETSTGSGYVQATKAAYKTVTYYTTAAKTTTSEEETDYWTGTGMSSELESALKTWASSATVTQQAVSDGTSLKFINLDLGYYVVTTTQGEQVISVDTTNKDAQIVDKNTTTPTAAKTVDKASYSIGDTITYTATFNTTNYLKDGTDENQTQVKSYTISDTLPEFLSDVKITSVKITQVGADASEEDKTAYPDADLSTTYTTFTNKAITIPWVGEDGTTSLYKNGSVITITYTAKLTGTVNINTDNKNTVTLTPNKDKDGSSPFSETYSADASVKTYGAALKKTDGTKALAGAEFTVAGLTVEAVSGETGVYKVTGYDSSSDTASTAMSTNSDGKLYIIGLASDVTLKVTESKAPDGYNKLTGTTDLTPQQLTETIYETTGTRYYDAKGNLTTVTENTTQQSVTKNYTNLDEHAVEIVNQKGTLLPSTGGIGTTIFYVIGGCLVAAAAVILIARKRRRA